jgi:hypothetical protein
MMELAGCSVVWSLSSARFYLINNGKYQVNRVGAVFFLVNMGDDEN